MTDILINETRSELRIASLSPPPATTAGGPPSAIAERILGRILDGARTLTGARYAVLGVLTEQRIGLQWFLTAGIDASTQRRIGHPPTGRGPHGTLIAAPWPLRIEDIGRDRGATDSGSGIRR